MKINNSNKNKRITVITLFITIILLIFLLSITIFQITGKNGLISREKTTKQKEIEEARENKDIEISYKLASYENNKFKILITIEDKENGIDTVYMPDGIVRNGNEKKILGIDYEIDEGVDYIFTVRNIKGIEVEETINFTKPIDPTIPTLSLEYPTITLTGALEKIPKIEIQYDERPDFINYYSLDDGQTWNLYTGAINVTSRKILAKSVHKKCSGIYTEASKIVEQPADALGVAAYDKNIETRDETNTISTKFFVDESTWWNKLKLRYIIELGTFYHRNLNCSFLDEDDNIIEITTYDESGTGVIHEEESVWIPEGTKSIILHSDATIKIYELSIVEDVEGEEFWPTFTKNMNSGIRLSASSSFMNNSVYQACDSNDNTVWDTDSGNYGPHEFKITFRTPRIVKRYYLKGAYSWGTEYKFYLEASNDDKNWIKLEGDTVHDGNINGNSTPGEYNIDLKNQTAYKYYRVYFPQGGWTYGHSGAGTITELKLFDD